MVTIERAKVEDVGLIKQALSETWLATYAAHLSRSTIEQVTTHWHDPSLLRSQIEMPKVYFAVARVAGTIIGLITAVALNQDELQIARLYVRPAYQRKGVGSQLLNAAISSYPTRRCSDSRSSGTTSRDTHTGVVRSSSTSGRRLRRSVRTRSP